MKYLFCVDPGLATGLALYDMSDPINPVMVWSEEHQVEGFYKRADEVVQTLAGQLEVVCENFIITMATAKKAQAPWSLRGVGVMEFLCMKYGVKFTLQTPADAKNFCDNERLHDLGFWHKGGEGHANDALRHGVLYMSRNNKKWNLKLLRASMEE